MKQVETQHTKPFGMNPKLNQEAKLTETSTCIRYGGKTRVNNAMIQIRELEKQEQNKPKLRREVTDQRRHKQNEENRKDK